MVEQGSEGGEDQGLYEQLLKKILKLGFFTREEAEPIARNWARTKPQSMKEVRQGILAERQRRDDATDARLAKEGLIPPQVDSKPPPQK